MKNAARVGLFSGIAVGIAGLIFAVALLINKGKSNEDAPITPSISVEQISDYTVSGDGDIAIEEVINEDDPALNVADEDPYLDIDADGIRITQELHNDFIDTDIMDSPFVKERAYMEDGVLKMYWDDPETGFTSIINVEDWQYYEDVTPILENFDITREDTGDLRIKGVLSFTQGEVMGIRLVVKDLAGNEIVVCEYDTTMYNMATLGKQVTLNQELKHADQWYELNHLGAGKYLYELDASGQYFSMQKVVSGELEIAEAEKAETPVAEQAHNTEQKGGVYNTVGADGKVVDFTAGGNKGAEIIDDYIVKYTDKKIIKNIRNNQLTSEQDYATVILGGNQDYVMELVPKVEEKATSDGFKYRMYDYGGIEYYMENAYHKPSMSISNIGSIRELSSVVTKNGGEEYISMKEIVELMDNDASILGLEGHYRMWYNGTCEGDSRDINVVNPGRKGDMIGAVEDFIEATSSLDTNVVHDKLEYAWDNMTLRIGTAQEGKDISIMPSDENNRGIIMDYTLAFTHEYTGEEICRSVGEDNPSLQCKLHVRMVEGHGTFELSMSATDESNIIKGAGRVEPAQRAELVIKYSFDY